MRVRRSVHSWSCSLTLGIALGTGVLCSVADRVDAEDAPGQNGLTYWVNRLEDPDFAQRIAAQRELEKLAPERLDAIGQLAQTGSPEVSRRLLTVLERVFQKNENAVGDRAEQVLMDLALGSGWVAATAETLLTSNARLREGRAREAIRQLGGDVLYRSPDHELSQARISISPDTGVGYGEPGFVDSIWLYEDWLGGSEELWHINRFSHVPHLVVYTSPINGLTQDDFANAIRLRLGVQLEVRGGCLGISSMRDGYGYCSVNMVMERTAADEAGLKQNDKIIALNNQPINSFDDLVEQLRERRAGDTIVLKFRRSVIAVRGVFRGPGIVDPLQPFEPELEIERTVRLGHWRNSHRGPQFIDTPTIFRGPFGPPLGDAVPPSPAMPERLEQPGSPQWQYL